MTLSLFLLLFSVGALTSPIAASAAALAGVTDLPGGRRTHLGAIPRAGGIAIFLPLLILLPTLTASTALHLSLTIGIGGTCLLGTLDDALSLSPILRLLAEGVLCLFALRLTFPTLPLAERTLALLFLLALINAANFLDGIDALLLSLALPPLFALALTNTTAAPIALATAALLLGFLPWNLPRARIFLGDGGSTTIGFLLGYLSLVALYLPSFLAPHPDRLPSDTRALATRAPLLLLLFFVFFLDLITTVIGRILRGASPFRADRTHVHHRLRALVGESRTRLFLFLLSVLSSLLFLLAA